MNFRDRLLGTLRGAAPILEVPGVLVVGSQTPNLLEPDVAATLVVSQDVDIAVPIDAHTGAREALDRITGFSPAPEEPSVWLPADQRLLELNFVGIDPDLGDAEQTYVLEDAKLPLIVFGPLSLLLPGPPVRIGGLQIPVPRPAGLLLEKLMTERSGLKGDRDLLVALALLTLAGEEDLREAQLRYERLPEDLRHAVRSGTAALSLLQPVDGMPDPRPHRERVAAFLDRLERSERRP